MTNDLLDYITYLKDFYNSKSKGVLIGKPLSFYDIHNYDNDIADNIIEMISYIEKGEKE